MNFSKLLKNKEETVSYLLTFIGLFLISTGISWGIFSFLAKPTRVSPNPLKSTDLEGTRSKISDLPKTEECPLNGKKYSKVEKTIWDKRRPIAAIIENHVDSRPSHGISKADVVYEAVAEGGITRFVAIFYCEASGSEVKIAPVRSARTYFLDWASEYGNKPIFMHVGGANNYSGSGDTAKEVRALETLESLGWRVPKGNDLDTSYDSGFPIFWRNPDRLGGKPLATEHTMMASLDAAYTEAQKRGFGFNDKKGNPWDTNFVSWKFIDDNPPSSLNAVNISFGFWKSSPEYNIEWKYDKDNNRYLRFSEGVPQIDFEYGKAQLFAKNVLILKVKEKGPLDRNKHMFYLTIGKGPVLFFQNGTLIEGTWEKKTRESRTRFYKKDGSEISFVRGPIWLEAVPDTSEIKID